MDGWMNGGGTDCTMPRVCIEHPLIHQWVCVWMQTEQKKVLQADFLHEWQTSSWQERIAENQSIEETVTEQDMRKNRNGCEWKGEIMKDYGCRKRWRFVIFDTVGARSGHRKWWNTETADGSLFHTHTRLSTHKHTLKTEVEYDIVLRVMD